MTNPLLSLGFDIPFDRIEPAHVGPAVTELLARAQADIDAIAEGRTESSYAGTLGALEAATEHLERVMTIVEHLESVATTDALRAAYDAVRPKTSAFFSSIGLNEGLYRAIKRVAESPEAKTLPPTERRHLEKSVADFVRAGAELPPEGKKRLAEIDVELADVTTKFSQNVVDATNAFDVVVTDEARLAGLPESARSAAREAAKAKGLEGHRFTLQAPSLMAVLSYADDRSLRETMYRASNARASAAPYDNRPLIDRILALRAEKAKLLGYESFADLVLEDRMAKSGARATAFVDDLRTRTAPGFAKENEALLAFVRKTSDLTELRPWDVGYYAEKQRKAEYDFDDEVLRPYFPAERALSGLFALANKLYGVSVKERPAATWNPAVRTYGIYDSDALIAAFYVDLHPRDDKRGGAWMNALVTGTTREGKDARHLGLFCANATPPIGDKPALLTHDEVETLFHEFGHLLHHALSRVSVRGLSGTNVAWDFVELPSQIMENFCFEREALDLFAAHYETGEKIPEALFEKLLRARTYRAANAQMRQLAFATLDLGLHRTYRRETDGEVVDYARKVIEAHSAVTYDADYAMICGFGHLFSSPVAYAAGYYSYKWAEVLDADAFTRFKREGVLSPVVGKAFREHVLSKGDSEDPSELYRAFMGRDPDLDALLARAGLLAA